MMITHKTVQAETESVKSLIDSGDVCIPEFWDCAWPGFIVMAWLVLVPLMGYSITGHLTEDVAVCSLINLVLGFIIFFMFFNIRSIYLSIPKGFREQSMILLMLRRKVKSYIMTFIVINLCLLILSISTGTGALGYYVPNMFILVFIGMIFSADIGRYRISAFTSVLKLLKSRKQGGE